MAFSYGKKPYERYDLEIPGFKSHGKSKFQWLL